MNLDTETNVLNAYVEETNDVVRTNRDWENMKGREQLFNNSIFTYLYVCAIIKNSHPF